MYPNIRRAVTLVWLGCILTLPMARGTDTYDYKPGETVVIDHGLSPDKQFSIAAGVTGKGASGIFHLFLVDAKTKKRIGPLEEASDALDTGAASIHAAWSPDSRHVAITYRVDRHELAMWIYRVADRRAFAVTGPLDLLDSVKGAKQVDTSDRREFFLEPKWLSAKQFSLHQESQYQHVAPNPASILGAYVTVEAEEDDGSDPKAGKKRFFVTFAADGVCELIGADKYRLLSVQPGKVASR